MRGERREFKKRQNKCSKLNFKGLVRSHLSRDVLLFIYLLLLFFRFSFHLVSLSRGGHSEGGGRDTGPYIDTTYFTENVNVCMEEGISL